MRRATFVLASTLAAAVLAGALLYHQDSLPSSVAVPGQTKTAQPQETPTISAERPAPQADQKDGAVAADQEVSRSSVNDEIRRRRTPEPDEATLRADMRKQATQDIRESYSLLLGDLDVSAAEKQDLEAVLIDMLVEGMWTGTSTFQIRGRKIPQQERYERIAAVIGDQKLLNFLELEQNVHAYWETTQVARLLRRNDVPLTEKQRDGVFDILVEVDALYPRTSPPPDVDNDSEEWMEHVLAQYDEHDRHVIELAPSVLAQDQVVSLFNQYQRMSRERVDSVERSRKLRAERPGAGWFFSPGSWN